ncbi:MAG: translation initiation factor IF-2 [Eubacteriales Family XIII. Incertae Sedis bacterium]|nr:MAG: translation initiation factor IF-2 [Clostridiales Family XIII bacterium]
MTVKVNELAKELNMEATELLDRIRGMGIAAESETSEIGDIDAVAAKNTILRSRSASETKIVKAAPKKSVKEESEEPKVVVKAAQIKPPVKRPVSQQARNDAAKTAAADIGAAEKAVQRPTVTKPAAFARDGEVRRKPPIGKPVISKELEEREKARAAAAAKAEKEKEEEKALALKAEQEAKAAEAAKKAEEAKQASVPAAASKPETKSEGPAQRNGAARAEGTKRQNTRGGDARDGRAGGDRNRGQYGEKREGKERDGGRQGERRQGIASRQQGQGRIGSGRADKPDMGIASSKAHINMEDKKKGDRERDKFAKLENAGSKGKKNAHQERSLEKAPKPKKHVKKEKQVEEPEIKMEELPAGTVVVTVPITVAGFCEQLQVSPSTVIMKLMKLGIMANINQNLDEDTVLILAEEIGVSVVVGKVEEEVVEKGIEIFEDKEEDLKPRPPIITVMGHVDHGKTSLLDAIRKTNVTASESGGITQHIGASEVVINDQKIVFLDTPGHEAFTAMRARGAHVTDIAVLVVAADDSVKPQTIESISHAKAAGVPIIVAINKIDKPGANPDRVKQDLTEHGILVEEWGGDTICVPVSAKTGEGIVNLLEMILLQAEVLELKANPNRLALGTVIEARLDKAKGPVATLLVLNGTLQSGMSVVAGTCSGRIRLMTNYKGETIKKAGPATAVEILGLTDVPEAGDEFNAVKEDKVAREIAENRKMKLREEVLARNASTTLEALFSQIQEGEVKELNLIIKGDVMGSVGAIVASLEKLKNENVRVKIIHTGVGTVTESDVMLAGTSDAVIIGFNVRPSAAVTAMADRDGVEIRTYRVIYDVIDDVEAAMKGMLDPEYKEVILGNVEIRNTFKVPGVGIVGGAYVTDGKVVRNAEVRLVRDGIVIHEGKISSLKRFKDDAKEVAQGYECGIGIENYNDIKEGDIIECFQMEEIKRG